MVPWGFSRETMTSSEIETIERATVAAVSPETVEELDGWLLCFDSGTVHRAHSAVPLRHAPVGLAIVDKIEARYQAHGLRTMFRLANEACFDELRRELVRRGYQASQPMLVQVAHVEAMRGVCETTLAETADLPDSAWADLFLVKGFDPVDGASRAKALSRARNSLFASVRENGKTVSVGAGAFSHGWSSVHGMRTDPALRGRGLAERVLASVAAAAMQRGIEKAFLQVEKVNASARSLYRRAGFETAWSYDYWTQPAV